MDFLVCLRTLTRACESDRFSNVQQTCVRFSPHLRSEGEILLEVAGAGKIEITSCLPMSFVSLLRQSIQSIQSIFSMALPHLAAIIICSWDAAAQGLAQAANGVLRARLSPQGDESDATGPDDVQSP